MKSIIQKYNIPGPRYTSYPTVPYWSEDGIGKKEWLDSVAKSFAESNDEEGISLYTVSYTHLTLPTIYSV